jgi:hypothetical protein
VSAGWITVNQLSAGPLRSARLVGRISSSIWREGTHLGMLSGGDLETCMILVNAVAVLKRRLVLFSWRKFHFDLHRELYRTFTLGLRKLCEKLSYRAASGSMKGLSRKKFIPSRHKKFLAASLRNVPEAAQC